MMLPSDASGAEPGCEVVESLVQPRGVAPGPEQLEDPRLLVEARLGPADDAVADEKRQDVVAVLALRLRHEHLEPVAKVPERFGAVAVVDEAVEGGEEDGAFRDGSVDCIRMSFPVALDELDALRAKAPFLADRVRVPDRDRLGLRPPARREIPEPLAALPAGDRDFSVEVEAEEHQADLPRAPPAVLLAFALRAILELPGEERPVSLDLAENVALEGAVLRQELGRPALALRLPSTAEVADPRPDERQVLDRVDERIPLEQGAVLPQQPVEPRAVVLRPEPTEEDEMLRALDRSDDVDLEEAEPADGLEHAVGAAVQQLRTHGDPPCLLGTDLHCLALTVV